MYWYPDSDIILLHVRQERVVEDTSLAETAFIWSGHGWTAPRLQEVKSLAMEFRNFSRRVLGMEPEDPIFNGVKTVYVIVKRRSPDGDNDWERHMTRFMCWYQQAKINNPRGFVEERKFDWDLKIVQGIDGTLDDGAFDAAVSEQDIGGWKDDPDLGTWRAFEETWRD